MNLNLTRSLRKTQYLENEERIRSLTSQGAKRNLHIIELKSFMDRWIKNFTHIKRGGLPLLSATRKDLIKFLLLWNLVGCKCQIPPPPYITTLLKGAKERQLSNWFSTFKLWTSWHCHTCESKEKLNCFLKIATQQLRGQNQLYPLFRSDQIHPSSNHNRKDIVFKKTPVIKIETPIIIKTKSDENLKLDLSYFLINSWCKVMMIEIKWYPNLQKVKNICQ